MNNHRRQEQLDMQKIREARVTIIGGGMISQYLCMYMAGLGIRHIKIIAEEQEGIFTNIKDENGLNKLEERILKINKEIEVKTRTRLDEMALGEPDAIAETTNKTKSKKFCSEYSERNNIPLINLASDDDTCIIQTNQEPENFKQYENKKQGSYTSGIISAIALDEIRKIIMPIQGEQKLMKPLRFSLHNNNRFCKMGISESGKNKNKGRILVVGVGGIGTYATLNLALMNIGEIDLMDGDKIEEHNLNRQIFYYDRIGENKAKILSERVKEITNCETNPIPNYLKHESQIKKKYTAILSCVDNWETRLLLGKYAKRSKIPLINGAVTTYSAIIEQPRCLECKYKKDDVLENSGRREGCDTLNTNVVMQNAFAGATMAGEAKAIILGYPKLEGKEIRYNTRNSDERKIVILDQKCECKTRG